MEHADARYTASTGRLVEPGISDSERHHATFNHIAGLASLLDFTILGPILVLILWRLRAKESVFIDDHGREAMNFQLSLLFYAILGVAAFVALSIVTLGVAAIFSPVYFAIGVAFLFVLRLIGCIMGAIAANRREYFRYPMCVRFITPPAQ